MALRAPKRRKLTPTPSDEEKTDRIQKAFYNNAAHWNLEQDYETRPRQGKKKDKEPTRLPIKTADGRVQPANIARDDALGDESDDGWLDESEAGSEEELLHGGTQLPTKPQLSEHEQIRQAKEELAKLALGLHENPEENLGSFKALAAIAQSEIAVIKKLCLVTQLSVYKDVIPGYRIRPASEVNPAEKLSKEVRRVRAYEQALVSGYQAYIKDLATCAKLGQGTSSPNGQEIAMVAIKCASTLLNAVPHFNFRSEIIRILVRRLSTRKVDSLFTESVAAFETLFGEDESGAPSKEAVSVLTKMMKARDYQIEESVLNLFLQLRLFSGFSGKVSRDGADALDGTSKSKQKREFRTKRERKLLKEQKSLAKDMAEADALVNHEERERLQSDTLKMVFATYFRILKSRVPHLMGAVQEGLVKYAHLINQDLFGDLLEALKDLMRSNDQGGVEEDRESEANGTDAGDDGQMERNTTREALLSTVTAFALLGGQDAHNARADLHLDLSYFVTHLYGSLLDLSVYPELERAGNSAERVRPVDTTPKPAKSSKVNYQTMTVLLVRCLTAVLLPPWNIRSVPPLRLAAFTKQLMTASLHMPEKSCQAILALIDDVVHTHGPKVVSLWNTDERKGDGTFNPLSASVEGSNPLASTIWESELLRRHYCPRVREAIRLVDKKVSTV